MFDWKSFLKDCRPNSADKDIKTQFSLQLQVDGDNIVKVRSKSAVSAKVQWGPWNQMMPHPEVSESELPAHDAVPEMQKPKEWAEFKDTIAPALLKFYNHKFAHPVFIPEADKREMLSFLQTGPPVPFLPEWIDWNSAEASAVRPEQPQPTATSTLSASVPNRRKKVWKPFLQPRHNRNGKKCKCGSVSHAKVTHASCPLNPKRVRDPDVDTSPPRARARTHEKNSSDEDSSSSDSSEDVLLRDVLPKTPAFPYPIGTRVAVEFSSGLFEGKITKLFSDTGTCLVVFSDGDKCEYDPDEIRYAHALYRREFVVKRTNEVAL